MGGEKVSRCALMVRRRSGITSTACSIRGRSGVGTFSRSMRAEDRERTTGDGKIAARHDRRPAGRRFRDDITVLRGSSSIVGSRKENRLYERALVMATRSCTSARPAAPHPASWARGHLEAGELFTMATGTGRCRWRRHRGSVVRRSSFLSRVRLRGDDARLVSWGDVARVFEVATARFISSRKWVASTCNRDDRRSTSCQSDGRPTAPYALASYLPAMRASRLHAARSARRSGHPVSPISFPPGAHVIHMRRVVARLCDDGPSSSSRPPMPQRVLRLADDGWSVVVTQSMFNGGSIRNPAPNHSVSCRVRRVQPAGRLPLIPLQWSVAAVEHTDVHWACG